MKRSITSEHALATAMRDFPADHTFATGGPSLNGGQQGVTKSHTWEDMERVAPVLYRELWWIPGNMADDFLMYQPH